MEPSFVRSEVSRFRPLKESADQRHHLVFGILQDVVPAVGKAVNLGLREAVFPLGQKVTVEDEVPQARATLGLPATAF